MNDDDPPDWTKEKQEAYEKEAKAYFESLDYGYDNVMASKTCDKCGYEMDRLPDGSYVHKKSRSTRCCNEKVWHLNCECHPPLAPDDEWHQLAAANELNRAHHMMELPKAFTATKPSWLERVLQFLFG